MLNACLFSPFTTLNHCPINICLVLCVPYPLLHLRHSWFWKIQSAFLLMAPVLFEGFLSCCKFSLVIAAVLGYYVVQDVTEARVVHRMLCDLVEQQDPAVLGGDLGQVLWSLMCKKCIHSLYPFIAANAALHYFRVVWNVQVLLKGFLVCTIIVIRRYCSWGFGISRDSAGNSMTLTGRVGVLDYECLPSSLARYGSFGLSLWMLLGPIFGSYDIEKDQFTVGSPL